MKLLDILARNPEAIVENKPLFSKLIVFQNFLVKNEPFMATYGSLTPDGYPALGNGLYMQKGFFRVTANAVVKEYGVPRTMHLHDDQIGDDNWVELNIHVNTNGEKIYTTCN
jgi:hypothetical protein